MRHTVGGAQNVDTPQRTIVSSSGVGGEPSLVHDQNGGGRVPRREDVAPGVLGPARRRDIEVYVAGPQADPVHGGQVPDRVRRVGVLDELRFRRRARREVEQQRIVGRRRPVLARIVERVVRVGVAQPTLRRFADGDARPAAVDAFEARDVEAARDHVRHVTAMDPVGEIVRTQQGRSRNDHRAELDRGENRLPQLDLVAQHQQHVSPRPTPSARSQPATCDDRADMSANVQLLLAAVLLDHPQRGAGRRARRRAHRRTSRAPS